MKEEKDEEVEEEDAEMKKNELKNEKKMHWIENVITRWKWIYKQGKK